LLKNIPGRVVALNARDEPLRKAVGGGDQDVSWLQIAFGFLNRASKCRCARAGPN
jgi:hypothetical protein